jgi:hypothetical protein
MALPSDTGAAKVAADSRVDAGRDVRAPKARRRRAGQRGEREAGRMLGRLRGGPRTSGAAIGRVRHTNARPWIADPAEPRSNR